ncbi:MAG: hypothetical protein ACP5OA_05795 [Candidatus Woesearchaeota archaeon]
MNKTIMAMFFGILLIGMFSLAFAVVDDGTKVRTAKTLGEDKSNGMTYGNCVSEKATVKNTCYSTIKDARISCRATAKNATESTPALKACRDTYKKDLKQCKTDFKQSKNECKKIKHSVFESAGSAFK